MGMADFLAGFRSLHEQAKSGRLPPEKQSEYEHARNELARSLVTMERVGLRPGQTWRQALRVPRAVKIELRSSANLLRTITIDLSVGGFGAPVGARIAANEEVDVTLHLPPGDPIQCRARSVSCLAHNGSFRLSAAWVGLGAADHDRIETAVFDTVLMKLR